MARIRIRERSPESTNSGIKVIKSEKSTKLKNKLILVGISLVLSIILNIYLYNR